MSPRLSRTNSQVRVLAAAHAANAVGDGGFYVTSALFFAHVVGLTPVQIGTGLTVAWATGFVASTPLGHLADRVGLRRSAVFLSLVTAAVLLLATLPRSMASFVLVATMYAVSQSASAGVRQALLVSLVEPSHRVLSRARVQTAVNGGIGLGAGLGGVALLVGTTTAYITVFILDAASFLISAGLLSRLPEPRPGPALAGAPTQGSALPKEQRLAVLRDRPYVVAALLNAVLYLYMPMLSVVLPLYIAARTAAPGWTIAAVFVLNTTGVVLFQVRAASGVRDLATATRAIRRAGVALLLACAAFAGAGVVDSAAASLLALALGAGLQILGEVLLAAGSWEVGFSLADQNRQGQWQALFSSGIPLARALGPLALTTLVLTWHGPGWLVLGCAFAVASLSVGPVSSWATDRSARHITERSRP
ncbi:MAG: MFS transporter [Nocardioidaceae bacterium]